MTYADDRNRAARARATAEHRRRMTEYALSPHRRVVVIDTTAVTRADEAWAVRQAVDFMDGRRAA